ncbi:hypothetical protein EJB05_06128, partial [Eragrostis curvula]
MGGAPSRSIILAIFLLLLYKLAPLAGVPTPPCHHDDLVGRNARSDKDRVEAKDYFGGHCFDVGPPKNNGD